MTLFIIAFALLIHQLSALSINATSGGDCLTQPAPTFAYSRNVTADAVLTSSIDQAFRGQKWDDTPIKNAETFTAAFKHAYFHSLGSMIDSVVPTCGNTLASGTRVDVSALSSMTWQNDEAKVGFSHHGPCEAWIDNKRVFRADCCLQYYSGYPAEIPIDFSQCKGNCRFTFYWLSIDKPQWQAFKQCVPIKYSAPSNSTVTIETNVTLTPRSLNATESVPGRVHAATTAAKASAVYSS